MRLTEKGIVRVEEIWMLIGLAGRKQSGKSSVTDYLCRVFDFHEVSWAYPLKEIIGRGLFGLDDEILYGDSSKREEIIPAWGMSGRGILQKVGTDLFRDNFDQNFWVKIGVGRMLAELAQDRNVVVSDCRFPNELDAIRQFGGTTCKIIKLVERLEHEDLHESERALDKYTNFDYTLTAGEGDLDVLFSQAKQMIHTIKGV